MFAGVLGSGLGLIIASNLSEEELYDWGWRIPFILGLIIAPVGLYVRMALPETLDEAQAHKSGTEVLRVLFTRNWGAIVLAVLCILGPTVSTYVSGYMTTYAIKTLNQPANVGMYVTMCGYIATLAGIPLAAWAADRVGARLSV
ncbi:MAG TPA: MFS transporter, partial [Alphaproteobacteria bacterium]|nr:MFS transporter [Alphaproteobacteria bacterium]